VSHNQRCAIFQEPPSLRDASDCNCGAIPPLPSSLSFEQALSQINLRKQNLDHIYEPVTVAQVGINKIREDELERVLEILSQVRP
jgi:hypothetical protein